MQLQLKTVQTDTHEHLRQLGVLRDRYEYIAQPLPPLFRRKLEDLTEPFISEIPDFIKARQLWEELQAGIQQLDPESAAAFVRIVGDTGESQHHRV